MPIFDAFAKSQYFSRQFVKLIVKDLPCFAYRANRDLKSKFETTLRLVSMSQIQWWSQSY